MVLPVSLTDSEDEVIDTKREVKVKKKIKKSKSRSSSSSSSSSSSDIEDIKARLITQHVVVIDD